MHRTIGERVHSLNESPELIAQECSRLPAELIALPASMKVLSLLLRNHFVCPFFFADMISLNESPELIAQE